jgi:hypothetical protein
MTKIEERENPKSCFSKALERERMFILLERDIATPATIRFWAQTRIQLGKNKLTDAQIVDALVLAEDIERLQK